MSCSLVVDDRGIFISVFYASAKQTEEQKEQGRPGNEASDW